MLGKTVQVLVEGESKLVSKPAYPSAGGVELGWERRASLSPQNLQLIGRTRGDQIVVFAGSSPMVGKLIDVEIVDAKGLTLFAKLGQPTSAADITTAIPSAMQQ